MVDEIFDRSYQSGRAELNDGIDRAVSRLIRSLATGFKTLNRIQFAAPWSQKTTTRDIGCA